MSRNPLKILIVDDQRTMLKIIKNLLGQIGLTDVTDVTSGDAALNELSTNNYDLIMSDWNMEPMTGLELLQKVRSNDNEAIKKLPFIMITAESKIENVVAAKQAGVDNYIVKPFNGETLKLKLQAVLGNRIQ